MHEEMHGEVCVAASHSRDRASHSHKEGIGLLKIKVLYFIQCLRLHSSSKTVTCSITDVLNGNTTALNGVHLK
jgi:hypothetical protein